MNSKWLFRLIIGVVIIVMALVIRSEIRGNALDEERYRIMVEDRDAVTVENEILRQEKIEVDEIAADSFAVLEVVIQDAERRITVIAAEGRQTFVEIIEAIPDSMPELRAQIELREEQHDEEIAQKDTIIATERLASDVLRGQLSATNILLSGVETELVLANDQIVFLEGINDDGLNNLESAAIGLGAYIVTTEAFDAEPINGLIIGGTTFLVVKGGSKFLSWIF